jgi:hypothetical protein
MCEDVGIEGGGEGRALACDRREKTQIDVPGRVESRAGSLAAVLWSLEYGAARVHGVI